MPTRFQHYRRHVCRGDWTIIARRALLLLITLSSWTLGIVLSDHTTEDDALVFVDARRLGLEGIVSKRLSGNGQDPDSPAMASEGRRYPSWIGAQRGGYCRHRSKTGKGAMRPPQVNYGWNPIETAPFDEEIALQVTDGRGGPYTLRWPCRLTASGWINSRKGTPLEVTPLRWKPYLDRPPRPPRPE
jgi:hypothetical protein